VASAPRALGGFSLVGDGISGEMFLMAMIDLDSRGVLTLSQNREKGGATSAR